MLTSEEDKSKIYNNLGNDYEALGDLSKALKQYKIALKSQPDSYEAHFNVGCCFYEEGSFGEAMGYF
jgi:tetratricopeptide (TPR) repeat protein